VPAVRQSKWCLKQSALIPKPGQQRLGLADVAFREKDEKPVRVNAQNIVVCLVYHLLVTKVVFKAYELNWPEQVDPVTRRVQWSRASARDYTSYWLQRN